MSTLNSNGYNFQNNYKCSLSTFMGWETIHGDREEGDTRAHLFEELYCRIVLDRKLTELVCAGQPADLFLPATVPLLPCGVYQAFGEQKLAYH